MRISYSLRAIILLVSTALALAACDDSKERIEFTHKVMVNNGLDFVSVNAEERIIELEINSQETCKIEGEANWFTLDKTDITRGKSTLVLRLEENKGAPRYSKIEFIAEGVKQPLMIQQNAANTSYEDVTHNFYVTIGTMPSLYAGLILLGDERPSYFFYERTQTYDVTQFPAHTVYTATGGGEEKDKMAKEMKKHILDINQKNPNAIFGIISCDYRARVSYDWFVAQGIDSSRVKVTLLSDGTGSYHTFFQEFDDPTQGEVNWKKHENYIKSLNWDAPTTKLNPSEGVDVTLDSFEWPYFMSTLPGYRYILQDANLFETNNSYVRERLENDMNTISLPPVEILNKLTPEKQDQFRRMTKFDSQTISAMFNESPKENLIIISTNPSSSILQYINETIDLYSGQYDIFMSVHPADPDVDKLKELEDAGKVKLFPQGLPFEVLLWSFMDEIHAIGGSQSTVFLTVPVEKVKFMYAKSAEDMIRPLNLIMKDQPGINWMIK